MTRIWHLALESRYSPEYPTRYRKLRYVITDGSRERVMRSYPGAYFVACLCVFWRNLTSVPSAAEVQRAFRMKELEALHTRLEMEASIREFERELSR